MLERMLNAGINGALHAILLVIIILPFYIVITKIKKHSEKKNFVEETDEEADEFIRKLKEKNKSKD